MAVVTINNRQITIEEGMTIIQACELADVEIPRFCYHERLAIAGNCRMCLVEVEGGPPKPVASCAMPAIDGMKIHTDSPMVKKAREGVMEFLLANHPLDCPICDQAGECDLQDQSYQYGAGTSRYNEHKRAVKDKDMGPLVETQMTRCIHCTRCVRFATDIAGVEEMGAVGRGETMEIVSYLDKALSSELSANIIDLCPVGALTSKPYAFKARSWELKKTESIDIMDAVGSNIRIDSRGLEVMRILPRLNEEINEEWISDKTRFCYDGLKYQRLDKSYVRNNSKLQAANFDQAFGAIKKQLSNISANQIACLTGSLSGVEEIFALKTLMQKLGSDNFDCRLRGEKFNSNDRASYLFNSTIANIEQADSCLLIGTNPKKEAPIINARLRKRYIEGGQGKFKVASIGFNGNLTYKYDYLGSEIKILEDILNGNSPYNQILAKSKKPMLIIGSSILDGEEGELILDYTKKIAEKYHIANNLSDPTFNGFNVLHRSSGIINGLEVGFTPSNGDNINQILQKADDGQIKLLFLHSVDDDIDFKKLEKCFVVYIGSHGDKATEIADVILPGATYTEKNAIYVNNEGRPQMTNKVVFAPGQAKEDLEIILDLAKTFDIDLGFKNIAELRLILAQNYPIFAKIGKITKANWIKTTDDLKTAKTSNLKNLNFTDFDFYLTNPIARASRTLNKCSVIFKTAE
jgi:NADH-quinone oxidoreductase subunit G